VSRQAARSRGAERFTPPPPILGGDTPGRQRSQVSTPMLPSPTAPPTRSLGASALGASATSLAASFAAQDQEISVQERRSGASGTGEAAPAAAQRAPPTLWGSKGPRGMDSPGAGGGPAAARDGAGEAPRGGTNKIEPSPRASRTPRGGGASPHVAPAAPVPLSSSAAGGGGGADAGGKGAGPSIAALLAQAEELARESLEEAGAGAGAGRAGRAREPPEAEPAGECPPSPRPHPPAMPFPLRR
jgi:hypothetical protein